jgi:hypothetical protein
LLQAVGYWAGGAREAGWWKWTGGVKVSWIHLWVESEVCYSLIREYRAGIFLLKYRNREYGRETVPTVPVPVTAEFLYFSCFPAFPAKTGHGRVTWDTVSVGTGFFRSRFHP